MLSLISRVSTLLWGWPLVLFVVGASIACTVILRGIQFRLFARAWKEAFAPSGESDGGDMSPLQAFVNTLSTNLGNGSLAGMATAVYSGGPGAALWAVIISLLLMSIRFAEVYLGTEYGKKASSAGGLGGPMLYLRDVPGGIFLAYMYGVLCFLFGNTIGNAMQANSISLSITSTWGVNPYIIATALLAFVMYVVLGGAQRIVRVSDRIVPIKVIVFFLSSFAVLIYHYQSLWSALVLMFESAFYPSAIAGGAFGFTVQQAIQYGIDRSIMATESGLGTAAVLFGFTGAKDSLKSALMGMLSTFISTIVCFLVALCIVVSGVWDSGLNSTALTAASFNTVFGEYGGWAVSFLSITFGIGVLVTFAYITRVLWLFITGGRWEWGGTLLFCAFTLFGALLDAKAVFAFGGILNAFILMINLFGVLWLTPFIARNLKNG